MRVPWLRNIVYFYLRNKLEKVMQGTKNSKYEVYLKKIAADFMRHPNPGRAEFEAAIEDTPGNVYWKDRNGVLRGCNLANARTFGFTDIEPILDKTDFDLLDFDSAVKIRKSDIQIMRSGKLTILEEGVQIGERYIRYKTYKFPIRNLEKQVVGIVGISLEIADSE